MHVSSVLYLRHIHWLHRGRHSSLSRSGAEIWVLASLHPSINNVRLINMPGYSKTLDLEIIRKTKKLCLWTLTAMFMALIFATFLGLDCSEHRKRCYCKMAAGLLPQLLYPACRPDPSPRKAIENVEFAKFYLILQSAFFAHHSKIVLSTFHILAWVRKPKIPTEPRNLSPGPFSVCYGSWDRVILVKPNLT